MPEPTSISRRSAKPPALLKYVVTVVTVTLAVTIAVLVHHFWNSTPYVSLLLCAVLFSAWFGGYGPAFLAVVLSTLAFDYFFLSPPDSLFKYAHEAPRFILYLVSALLVGLLGAVQQASAELLEEARDKLASKVEELRQTNHVLHRENAESKRMEKALRLSETRLEEAQRVAHIGHWERDPVTNQITCSEETFRILGLASRPNPLSLADFQQMIHPDDQPLLQQIQTESQQGLRPIDVEYRIVRPGGEVRFVHALGNVTLDDSGRPGLVFGTLQDITDRKRTERLLEGQRQVLEMISAGAALPESLTALVRVIEANVPDMLGSILLLDKAGLHLCHGAAPSLPPEYVNAIDGKAIGPNAGSCGTAAYLKEPVIVEDIATDPRWQDYREFALSHGLRACWSSPIFDDQHRVVGTFAMYYRDPSLPKPEHLRLIETTTHIAAIAICRHHDQAELKESEARLKEAERLANIGYWERDVLADRITWSDETYRIFGLKTPNGVITQAKLQERIHPEDRPLQRKMLAEALQEGRPYDVEYRILRPTGEVRFIHVRDELVRDESGRTVRMFGTVQDITERKQAEILLHAREQEIRAIVENSPDLIVRFDRNLHRTYVNQAFIKANGLAREALLGREIGSQVKDGAVHATSGEVELLRQSLHQVLETGRPLQFENTWPMPAGRRTFCIHLEPEFDASGRLATILTIARDITDVKESEEKLRVAEAELARVARVTMMGELAASIAHEVNQPLAAVVTNANAVSRWLAASPPDLNEAREAVRRIAREGTRASKVIERIRALIQKTETSRLPTNLNELILETVALTQPELARKKVTVKTDLAPALPLVPADRVQLQQVLLNLIVNALDSLGAVVDRPRVLQIRTGRPQTGTVQITVQDNGRGIDPQAREHLFDPFYTTKAHGLGMGLAISHSIVEAHGGRLWAGSSDPSGAIFQFTLPAQEGGGS